MSTEQNNAGPVAFGCHCDLEPGMEPDGCVIDKGMPEDCTYARRISSKEQCVFWKPITPPAADPAPAVPQGVLADMREFASAKLTEFLGPHHMALTLSQKINEWADLLAAAPQGEPSLDLIAVCKEVSAMAVYVGDGECSIQFAIIQRLDAALAATPAAPSQEPVALTPQRKVIEIVSDHLTAIGADGLVCPDADCACRLGALAPCDGDYSNCQPGWISQPRDDQQDDWCMWTTKQRADEENAIIAALRGKQGGV